MTIEIWLVIGIIWYIVGLWVAWKDWNPETYGDLLATIIVAPIGPIVCIFYLVNWFLKLRIWSKKFR